MRASESEYVYVYNAFPNVICRLANDFVYLHVSSIHQSFIDLCTKWQPINKSRSMKHVYIYNVSSSSMTDFKRLQFG